jgi:hypothetical protein
MRVLQVALGVDGLLPANNRTGMLSGASATLAGLSRRYLPRASDRSSAKPVDGQ